MYRHHVCTTAPQLYTWSASALWSWHAGQDQLPSRLGGPALPEGSALPIVLRPLPALAGLEGRERAWCTMHKSASLPYHSAQAADTLKFLARLWVPRKLLDAHEHVR